MKAAHHHEEKPTFSTMLQQIPNQIDISFILCHLMQPANVGQKRHSLEIFTRRVSPLEEVIFHYGSGLRVLPQHHSREDDVPHCRLQHAAIRRQRNGFA